MPSAAERLGQEAARGSLSASAAPYVPSAAAATRAGQGPSKSAVLELAVALAPQGEEQAGLGDGSWPQSGAASYGKARWPAADETPKTVRRSLRTGRGGKGMQMEETPNKAARAAAQLRQLLDFYFEPFNLQHNRYLLDLLARRTPAPPKPGPWPADLLADFRFSFDDLMGLGRIASALAKLKLSQCEALGTLKHLRWTSDGRLQLRSPPEVRSFVAARSASADAVSDAVRYLAAVREQRGQVPPDMLSVLFYALGGPLADDTVRGAHRQAQLKRQLLLHHTDVMCLAGLDPESSGSGIATTLIEDGYSYAWARSESGEVNTIFWDRSRLELLGHWEVGAAIAADLRSLEDKALVATFVCFRPEVPTSSCTGPSELFKCRHADGQLVACADLTLLGGAESAAVVEELAGLRSLPREVLGDELLVPLSQPNPQDGEPEPVRAGASGLNRLHYPDSMLYEGLTPLLALSGHNEHHLATMAFEDIRQQFPAFRIPVVAAFQWRGDGHDQTVHEV